MSSNVETFESSRKNVTESLVTGLSQHDFQWGKFHHKNL